MKTRMGFVSNSSSSSFVICFPRRPVSAAELHKWMFPDGQETIQAYDDPFPTTQIAEQVWRDIGEQEPLTAVGIAEAFSDGSIHGGGFPKHPDCRMPDDEWEASWEKYDADKKRAASRLAETFMSAHPDGMFFQVEYSDNEGPFFVTMEHGDVFRNVPHQQISKH